MLAVRAEDIHLGVPPSLAPQRPEAMRASVLGRRVVLNRPDGFVRDMRACSAIFERDGRTFVRVCTEAEWYAARAAGREPAGTQDYPVYLVWVEQ